MHAHVCWIHTHLSLCVLCQHTSGGLCAPKLFILYVQTSPWAVSIPLCSMLPCLSSCDHSHAGD